MSLSLVLLVGRLYFSQPYCYIMFALFIILSLHKTCTGKSTNIESQNTFVCERAIFGVFDSFTDKKVNFYTINVKFKVILSSKSGGEIFVQAIPPPEKVGGGGVYPPSPPPPPGIYASASLSSCRLDLYYWYW